MDANCPHHKMIVMWNKAYVNYLSWTISWCVYITHIQIYIHKHTHIKICYKWEICKIYMSVLKYISKFEKKKLYRVEFKKEAWTRSKFHVGNLPSLDKNIADLTTITKSPLAGLPGLVCLTHGPVLLSNLAEAHSPKKGCLISFCMSQCFPKIVFFSQ